MNRLKRIAWSCTALTFVCLVVLLLPPGAVQAEGTSKPLVQEKQTLKINSVGDGQFTVDVKLPIRQYTILKAKTPNTALLVRELGLGGSSWFQIEKVHGDWHDDTNTVQIQWTTRGLARVGTDGFWQAPLASGLEMIAVRDNLAVFSGATAIHGGVATEVAQVFLPEGSRDLKVRSSPTRLAFHMPRPGKSTGRHPAIDVQFEAQPRVMTCLAKLYSNSTFSKLWAARTVIRNTGDQVLRDFRIRFHLTDYTSGWGPWQRDGYVVPGQTVVNAYFPVFNLEKVARLNATSPASLEMEYEYREADGQTVHGSDARTIHLLGHNEMLSSNMPAEEVVTWQDQLNLGPIALAAFVAHHDPVIQEVAGMVSGQGEALMAEGNDQHAIEFLHRLYDFMVYNRIAYQTPPVHMVDEQFGCQHVKYGRDVLRNHSGTCVDLAIFYGSVCEAVGLKPVLFLVPGHCFPAIRLPSSGKVYAVEATGIAVCTFERAVQAGAKEVREAEKSGQVLVADIVELHGQGVHGLELPPLPASVLKDWGYRAVPPKKTDKPLDQSSSKEKPAKTSRNDAPPADRQPTNSSSEPSPIASAVVGKWVYRGQINGDDYDFRVDFGKDGHYRALVKKTYPDGFATQTETSGTYQVEAETLTATSTDGSRRVYSYVLQKTADGTVLQMYINDLRQWIPLRLEK